MKDEYLSVAEIAQFLQCTDRTVRNLIHRNQLGADYVGGRWLVSLNTAKAWLLTESISRSEASRYRRRLMREENLKIVGKNADANWSSSRRKSRLRDPSGETQISEAELIEPAVAAVRHQYSLGWMARRLRPRDPALQDDLVQEMSLAILLCKKPATRKYFLDRALSRAINYLEYERVRGMLSIEEIADRPDPRAEQRRAFEQKIESLIERGVPQRWIEQYTGLAIGS